MNFFLDNCLSPHLAQALQALAKPEDHTVKHLRELFSPETADVVWIAKLGEEGEWIVISGDLRILKNKHEREAFHQANLILFVLAKGWVNHDRWGIA